MKIAVIGAGRNRNGIGEYIAKYFYENGARVMAVLGTTAQTAEKASHSLKKYGIGAIPYTDFAKMVGNEKPEAIVIASPSSTHADYLTKCVDASLNIFCEKPFIRPETGGIKGTIEGIFEKVKGKKLTVAMNSQLPFSLEYYEKICGRIEIKKPNKFLINMSPLVSGKEMIPESVPHALSLLYALFGEGELEGLNFESAEVRKISIKFKYVTPTNQCTALIRMVTHEQQPRDLSFGFNDKIVTRTIDLENYDICFNYRNKKLKVDDPLGLSVKDFIMACEKKTEPLIGYDHIINNMSLLKQIYDSYT